MWLKIHRIEMLSPSIYVKDWISCNKKWFWCLFFFLTLKKHQNQNVSNEEYSQVEFNDFQHKIVVLSEEIETPKEKPPIKSNDFFCNTCVVTRLHLYFIYRYWRFCRPTVSLTQLNHIDIGCVAIANNNIGTFKI